MKSDRVFIDWRSKASKNTATVVAISKIQAESKGESSSPQKPMEELEEYCV